MPRVGTARADLLPACSVLLACFSAICEHAPGVCVQSCLSTLAVFCVLCLEHSSRNRPLRDVLFPVVHPVTFVAAVHWFALALLAACFASVLGAFVHIFSF